MIDALRRHSVGLLVGTAAALAVAILGSLAVTLLVGIGTLFAGGSVLAATLPFLVAALALAAVEAAVVVGLVWLFVQRVRSAARLPRDERLARPLRRLEDRVDALAALRLSTRLTPDPADRRAEVHEQYVAGEIGEREFERRMERLLADDGGERSDRVVDVSTDAAGDLSDEAERRRRRESERAG